MDVYKVLPDDTTFKVINKESFEADTRRAEPWYQTNSVGKEVHFAVCPACDNPIQIIGLYHLPPNVKNAYGRHLAHGVPRLAPGNDEARENCPYFKPRKHQKTDRKQGVTGTPLKILEVLIAQFDRVVYLIQKQTGISLSKTLMREMLLKYRGERGYLYTGATLMNVPWIFAYMADSQSLFKQRVAGNAALCEAILAGVPNADISDNGSLISRLLPGGGKKGFFQLNVCYIHHGFSKYGDEGGLSESMRMIVSATERRTVRDIYTETIDFDHQYFQNLINQPEGQGYRKLELVQLARGVLGDLLPGAA